MAIKPISALNNGRRMIDLTGPEGNACCLMGIAQGWAKQLGRDADAIIERMKAGDYENLINVFDEEFGDFVDLYR